MEKRGLWNYLSIRILWKRKQKGHLYGLIDQETNQLVCGAVLLEEDARWKDQANAYYIHNLASNPYQKGTGKLFFSYL